VVEAVSAAAASAVSWLHWHRCPDGRESGMDGGGPAAVAVAAAVAAAAVLAFSRCPSWQLPRLTSQPFSPVCRLQHSPSSSNMTAAASAAAWGAAADHPAGWTLDSGARGSLRPTSFSRPPASGLNSAAASWWHAGCAAWWLALLHWPGLWSAVHSVAVPCP
jgi:hypothetical protein